MKKDHIAEDLSQDLEPRTPKKREHGRLADRLA